MPNRLIGPITFKMEHITTFSIRQFNESVLFLYHTFPTLSRTIRSIIITNNTAKDSTSGFQVFWSDLFLSMDNPKEEMFQLFIDLVIYAALCFTTVATTVAATKTFIGYYKPFKKVVK